MKKGGATVDIFTYELEAALAAEGCPLCRSEELDLHRWMGTFVREAHNDAGVRKRFLASRGFCPAHAELLLEIARGRAAIAVVAAVYAGLVDEDLAGLRAIKEKGRGRLGRKAGPHVAMGRCPACLVREHSAERKLYFFCEELAKDSFRRRYARSDGLCAPHFLAALEEAAQRYPDVHELLLEDWLTRLTALRLGLSEFERKRDHRFAHEPRGVEREAPGRALRHYAGAAVRRSASLPREGD
jgi:hypothetical protein